MRTHKVPLIILAFTWWMAIQDVKACWIDIPLERVVKKKPLVVVGEIQRITLAPKSRYDYDTAFIKIEHVLKNSGGHQTAKVGAEIPLAMPSVNNESQVSTDLRYSKGQRGVWILDYREGKYWATYPKDFQRSSEISKIRAIIRRQK